MRSGFENIRYILSRVLDTQKEGLEAGAQRLARATQTGHNIFAFGCSHAGLLALEMYYRSGGMATKISAAKIAKEAGIPCAIVSGHDPNNLYRLFDGEEIGTFFI